MSDVMEFEAKRAVYILLYIANIDVFKFKIDSLASLWLLCYSYQHFCSSCFKVYFMISLRFYKYNSKVFNISMKESKSKTVFLML